MPTAKARQIDPEEAAGTAKGWEPEPGDNLTGKLVHIEKVESQWGEYPMLTIETAPGEYTNLHAFHSTLLKALTKMAPKPGDNLSVTFHGKRDTKAKDKDGNARQFAHYTVRNPDKAVEAFSWDSQEDADF